jgi:cephalosporin-C deacetylase-like acetyl esterase
MRPILLLMAARLCAQTSGNDVVPEMVAGMSAYLEQLTAQSKAGRRPSAEKLRAMLGVVEQREAFDELELIPRSRTARYQVFDARWPVWEGVTARGLYYRPVTKPVSRVVVLAGDARRARELAAAGCEVLSVVLIDTASTYSANPYIGKRTEQPHREWIYRMAFPVGRTIYGYEVQKTLAAVDWFSRQSPALPVAVYGDGEGAAVATFAAVLDPRIAQIEAHGFSVENPPLWKQPLHRNVFGMLRDFGDAEFSALLRGRQTNLPKAAPLDQVEPKQQMREQVRELVEYTQRLVRDSESWREQLWQKTGPQGVAAKFVDEVIGVLPGPAAPLNLKRKPYLERDKWRAWEVRFDVRPGVFGYGFLLIPKDLKAGEKRPLVVVQHGLNGRGQVFFDAAAGKELDTYRNLGAQLADLGYIVYSPQNPYVGDFRHLARLANPLGLSLYSLIRAQYQVMLDWLVTLPEVDAARIGFYGLSYGGKTALRIPPLDPRYKVAVCGGDFNEWIRKLTSVEAPYSYMFTHEYEILEWNVAAVANHAELAMLMAPRAFLVERGHRDGVGSDEWVSYEYAKVRRFYEEAGLGDRTGIAFFNGPHRVDGPAAIEFLRRFLGR